MNNYQYKTGLFPNIVVPVARCTELLKTLKNESRMGSYKFVYPTGALGPCERESLTPLRCTMVVDDAAAHYPLHALQIHAHLSPSEFTP
jgi:hypothetical protein